MPGSEQGRYRLTDEGQEARLFYRAMKMSLGNGLKVVFRPWAEGVRQLPVDRSGSRGAGEPAIGSGLEVLGRGELFGIYPEGTRSPDGHLHRGRPCGLGRLALLSGAPVAPVAMPGTEKIQPPGRIVPGVMRPGIRIGGPMDFSRCQGMEHDRFVLRA